MGEMTALNAIKYATSKDLLSLYIGFLIFWLLQVFEEIIRGGFPVRILNYLIPMALSVVSFGVLIITIVAIVHKVISDSLQAL